MPLTPEEAKEVLSKPFEVWPKCECEHYCKPRKYKRAPYSDQIEAVRIPHPHNLDIVCGYGGGRGGKCLRKGTEVIMADGAVKAVEDIVVGDEVLSPSSTAKKVVGLARGTDQFYKISFLKYDPIYVNGSHILALKCNNLKAVMAARYKGEPPRTTKRYKEEYINISVEDYLNWPSHKKKAYVMYQPPGVEFCKERSKLEIDPYMLGVWLGDGHVNSFTIATMDPEIKSAAQKLAKEWNHGFNRRDVNRGSKASTYAITCQTGHNQYVNDKVPNLTNTLTKLGIIHNKRIPHHYLTASRQDRLQLLAGIIDTDGYNNGNRYFEVVQTASKRGLVEDIVFLARSLGFAVTIKEKLSSYTWKGEKRFSPSIKLNICGDGLDQIPCKLKRKQIPPRPPKKFNQLHRSFTIEKIGVEDYYGFELEGPDHLFLLKDFLVVHNSICASAAAMTYALKYPGCTILVGADTRELLKRTAMRDWERAFSIHEPWDHPLVYRKPHDQNKALKLRNGTTVWFLHFSDFKILRGTGVSFAHIEEASLIKESDALEEIVRRCSETKAPQRQIFLTTNPEESKGWVYDTFNLKQFEPGYDGPRIPIGRPCKCQFCHNCLNQDGVEVEWVNNRCLRCPTTGKVDELGNPLETFKTTSCPGDVEFMRVVFFDPSRNPHVPPDYYQSNKQFNSEAKFNLYTKGQVIELRQGRVYKNFSSVNVPETELKLDYDKELFWSFDFNISFQCSVLCQEKTTADSVEVDVVDELVVPEAGPEHVAKEFLRRYPTYNKDIHMYGDPAALNRKVSSSDVSQFQIIHDIITDPFNNLTEEELKAIPNLVAKTVKVMPRKRKGNTKINVKQKVDSLNYKLCDPSGNIHLRVSKHCLWLIRSLEDMRWKESAGRDMLDTQCDKSAAKNPDKSKVRLLSHPTDALAYYIAKKWPVVADPQNGFVLVPGGLTVEMRGSSTNTTFSPPDEEAIKSDIEKLKDRLEPAPGSLLDYILGEESQNEIFKGYFF